MTESRRALLRLEVPFGLLGAALLSLAFLFARSGIPGWVPPSPLARVGLPSPLTGMTRSFVSLAGGDVRAAFGWHPLGPVCFAASAIAAAVATLSWIRGRRLAPLARALARRPVWVGVAAASLAVWVRQILVVRV